jgi:hypothetical protein
MIQGSTQCPILYISALLGNEEAGAYNYQLTINKCWGQEKWVHAYISKYVFMVWYLVKHRKNVTFQLAQ